MSSSVQKILKTSLDALVKKDGSMARKKMYQHLDIAEQEMFGSSIEIVIEPLRRRQ